MASMVVIPSVGCSQFLGLFGNLPGYVNGLDVLVLEELLDQPKFVGSQGLVLPSDTSDLRDCSGGREDIVFA